MHRIDICSDLHVDRHHGVTRLLTLPGEGPSHWPVGAVGDRDQYFHFDFQWYRNAGSSTLIVAGDVSDNHDDVADVLGHACKFYDHVVFVDGNHEHHGNSKMNVVESTHALNDLTISLPNLTYLDGHEGVRKDLNGIAFIGGNGWYDWKCFEPRGVKFPDVFASWDDRSGDAALDFGAYCWPNELGSEQINNMVEAFAAAQADPNIDSIVMVTHTAPMAECVVWHDDRPDWNLGSPSYVNTELGQIFDLDINGKLKLWAYGHTHTRRTWSHRGVTMVNNCYGYPKENLGGWTMVNAEVI